MGKSLWKKIKCKKCCPSYKNWRKEKTQVASDDCSQILVVIAEDDNAAENISQGTTQPGQAILDIYEQKEKIAVVGQIEDLDHGEEFVPTPVTKLDSEEKNVPNLDAEEELLLTSETEGERKEETEAGTVWDSIRRGSISQADITSPYSNNQCTSIALTAAGTNEVKSISTWVSVDIDMVLYQGDENHDVYRSLFKVSSDLDARISLDDIALRGSIPVFLPTIVAVAKITDIWRGMLFYPDKMSITEFDKISIPLLSEVLAAHLTQNSPMIVTIGEFSTAFIKEGDRIWLFDSHCRSETGERCVPLGTGKAFTVPFDDIGQIAEYLEREYRNSNEYQAVSIQYSFPSLD